MCVLCVGDMYIQRCRHALEHTHIHTLFQTLMQVWFIMVYNQNIPDPIKHEHTPDVVRERPCCFLDSWVYILQIGKEDTDTHTHARTQIHIRICARTQTHGIRIRTRTQHTRTRRHTRIHARTRTRTYARTHTKTNSHVHTRTHTDTHMQRRAHANTHADTNMTRAEGDLPSPRGWAWDGGREWRLDRKEREKDHGV